MGRELNDDLSDAEWTTSLTKKIICSSPNKELETWPFTETLEARFCSNTTMNCLQPHCERGGRRSRTDDRWQHWLCSSSFTEAPPVSRDFHFPARSCLQFFWSRLFHSHQLMLLLICSRTIERLSWLKLKLCNIGKRKEKYCSQHCKQNNESLTQSFLSFIWMLHLHLSIYMFILILSSYNLSSQILGCVFIPVDPAGGRRLSAFVLNPNPRSCLQCYWILANISNDTIPPVTEETNWGNKGQVSCFCFLLWSSLVPKRKLVQLRIKYLTHQVNISERAGVQIDDVQLLALFTLTIQQVDAFHLRNNLSVKACEQTEPRVVRFWMGFSLGWCESATDALTCCWHFCPARISAAKTGSCYCCPSNFDTELG